MNIENRYSKHIMALMAILILLSSGCFRNETLYSNKGDILQIVASTVEELESVLYSDGGKTYEIKPSEEGLVLAMVNTRIINQMSTQISLSVDNDAAKLTMKEGPEVYALEYMDRGMEVNVEIPDDYSYRPFVWGEVAIPLGYEVSGWMMFEVPVGSDYLTFIWEDTDFVRIMYQR